MSYIILVPPSSPTFFLHDGSTLQDIINVNKGNQINLGCKALKAYPPVNTIAIGCKKQQRPMIRPEEVAGNTMTTTIQVTKDMNNMTCTCQAAHVVMEFTKILTFNVRCW